MMKSSSPYYLSSGSAGSSSGNGANSSSSQRHKTGRTLAEIKKLARERQNRRKSAEEYKIKRANEARKLELLGTPGDVDFQRMIRRFRKNEMGNPQDHDVESDLKITVVVRKRPVNEREIGIKDYDSVSCSNPLTWVHSCKLKVDGISKTLTSIPFVFDHSFDGSATNETVYAHTVRHLVNHALYGGRTTCFAYGQTGSGKTFTMSGIQELAAQDLFSLINSDQHSEKDIEVHCSFFELYGGRSVDLLHDRRVCSIREDGKGRIHVEGLGEVVVSDESELLDVIARGNSSRTTHTTEMNDYSSRSHAICQIALRRLSDLEDSEPYGKLSLVDLAGSERGQDVRNHSKQRQQESGDINKSLLALKECIRALDSGSQHVPYRGSKLTMVLKDSFAENSKTVMITCISPTASSSEHTLNTLRYADRVKEKVARRGIESNYKPKRYECDMQARKDDFSDSSLEIDPLEDFEDDVENREGNTGIETTLPPPPSAGTPAQEGDVKNMIPGSRTYSTRVVDRTSQRSSLSSGPRDQLGFRNTRPSDTRNESTTKESSGRKPLHQRNMSSDRNVLQSGQSRNDTNTMSSRFTFSDTLGKRESMLSERGVLADEIANDRHVEVDCVDEGLAAEIKMLVDAEEHLLAVHVAAMQENADTLSKESLLLAEVQGEDVVDYDIESYAQNLDALLVEKMEVISNLRAEIKKFQRVANRQN